MSRQAINRLQWFAVALLLLACVSTLLYLRAAPVPPPNLPEAIGYRYKDTPTRPLYLYALKPPPSFTGLRPAILMFFGGGWTYGSTNQLVGQARHFAERGFVAVLADYRIRLRDNTTPFDAVRDARSAMRWLRAHAGQLSIDPARIVAAGISAGGHLAGATALLNDVNESSDDPRFSPMPDALVLYSPVLDTMQTGFGAEILSSRAREASLMLHLRAGLPPTLILHGTADSVVPFRNSQDFTMRAKALGNDCELVPIEGAGHAFSLYTGSRQYEEMLARVDAFLAAHGFK